MVFGVGTVTLSSKNYLNSNFGTTIFFSKYGAIIFIVTVFSFFMMITSFFYEKRQNYKDAKKVKEMQNYVKNLDEEKLEILRRIYYSPGHIAKLHVMDANVQELKTAIVISPSINNQSLYVHSPEEAMVSFHIEPWAKNIFLEMEK